MTKPADVGRSQRHSRPGWGTAAEIVAAALLLTFGALATFVAVFTWQLGVLDLEIDRAKPRSPAPYVTFYGGLAAACFELARILAMRVRRRFATTPGSERK